MAELLAPQYTGKKGDPVSSFLNQLLGLPENYAGYEDVYPTGTPSYDIASDSVNPSAYRQRFTGVEPGTPVDGLPSLEPSPPGRNPTEREFSPTDEEITAEEFGDVGYTGPEKVKPGIEPQFRGDGRERINDASRRAEADIPDDDVQDMDLTGALSNLLSTPDQETAPPDLSQFPIGGGDIPPGTISELTNNVPVNVASDDYQGLNPNDLPLFRGNATNQLTQDNLMEMIESLLAPANVPGQIDRSGIPTGIGEAPGQIPPRAMPSPLQGLANHPAARIDTAQAGASPSIAGINRLIESISGAASANTSQMPQFGGEAVRYGGNPNVRPPTQGMTQPQPPQQTSPAPAGTTTAPRSTAQGWQMAPWSGTQTGPASDARRFTYSPRKQPNDPYAGMTQDPMELLTFKR
jgi:hypothetical protein